MHPSIYIALSGSIVQEERLNTITHNLANVNTPGYKKDIIGFRQYFLSALEYIQIDFTPGPLLPTDNPFDLAIEGDGFFVIETPDGIRYTRRGDFKLDQKHRLVTKQGFLVLGKKGVIFVRGKDFVVDQDGIVRVDGVAVDSLRIENFPKGTILKKEQNGLFVPMNGATSSSVQAKVKQGYLEGANVNIVKEMANMIQTLRNYETCQKLIQCIDEITGRAINEVGIIKI
ncbi:MAG: flagellar hook-basal body protein [Candidatus Desulfofervidus auxilii]|nr:flagellar hook-basal body protein [Candidatus Desulfofervidus auxilii]